MFAPSEFDPHEWRSALTLWAVCDWRGRPSTSHIGGRDDLTPGAQRTLLEMANMRGGTVYDGKALAMLASPLWSRSEAIYDPAFVGLRNARDSDKYLSAETCANYRFADPNTAQTPNDDRDGAWGLWAKWVTDRANIEPDDGADSRRHALGMGSGDAPDSQDRSIQKDTVDSINGASWTGRLLYSAVTILTAALYGFSLAGMGLGTLIAQFLVGGIVAVMPLLLVLMALPVQAAQQLPRKVFKLLIGSLFAHLIFLFILSLGIMCIGILNQVLGGLTGNFLVRSMLFAFVPLISLFAVNGLTKQFGLKIISPKGAMLATTGIALAAMRPPNLNVSQFAGRARSRYEQISDRADVRRETDRLEARSGESRVRTQPRMRAPDSGEPALALNSKSSPAAIAAGALATMGSRLPRGTGRRPGVASTPGRPGAPLTPPTGSGDSGVVLPRASGGSVPPIVAPPPPAVSPAPPPQPTGEDAPQVAAPPEPALRPSETPTPPPAILSPSVPAAPPTDVAAPAARTEPTSVVPPRRPFEPVDPGPSTYANMRTQPPRPDHADTEVAEGEHHGDVGPAKGPRLAESVEMAAVRAGRAAKATQWGALKAGRWVRDHRRAIKRVAVGSLIAMGAVGMSAAAAPLAVGYAGAKFIGWRYRRQLQAAHLVRTPQERAEERVERREHRHTKRQDREMRVEQRVRRRAEGPGESAPSALSPTSVVAPRRPHLPSGPSTRPPTSVVAPRGADPRGTAATPASQVRIPEIPAVNPERATAEPAPSDEPEPSLSPEPEPAPAPQAGSPTEMTAAQAGYLTGLAESTGLDPSAVFEAVAGDRLRASEAIDVLRGGAPADGDEGTLMDRVIAVTSRVRLPSPRPEGPAVEA